MVRKGYCGIKIKQILKTTKSQTNSHNTFFILNTLKKNSKKYRPVLCIIHLFISITANILTNSSIFSSKDPLYVAGMYMIPVKGQK